MATRYQSETLQQRLAAEYVLGNLRGAARRRMVALMRSHAGLRDQVSCWEERLFPALARAPQIQPPARVWRAIKQRIAPGARRRIGLGSWWARLASGGLAAATLVALLYLSVALTREPAHTMIAVLNDARAQPSILVSWTPQQAAKGELALRILTHPSMPPDTSWQAWLLSAHGAAPLSLGFVTMDPQQLLKVSPAVVQALKGAAAIGVSVEGKTGSASGRPTGPFMFEGPVLRVDS